MQASAATHEKPHHQFLLPMRALGSLLVVLVFVPARADVSLPKIVGDNMVLQRGQVVPIWGRATPGENVTVRFAGQEKHTTAGTNGNWHVHLEPLVASAESRVMEIAAGNTIQLRNILVGEVWLCSGQSNMELPAAFNFNPDFPGAQKTDQELTKDANGPGFPTIRLFRVQKIIQTPDVVSTGWSECQGEALAKFSAIGYIFARELQSNLGLPIGMIQSAWGGSRIELWTPREAQTDPWSSEKERPAPPAVKDRWQTGKYYDGMVRPLVPFAIRGVLWYQGESNVGDGIGYADKMEALINGWRMAWQQPELPFFYVQLAPYAYSQRPRQNGIPRPVTALPEIWEAQRLVTRIPKTGLVPTIDLADNVHDIHPQLKRPVADRLAKLALSEVYRQTDLVHDGPVVERVDIQHNGAVAYFRQTGTGLKSRDGQPLTQFEIAGEDGKFVPAQAVIEGSNIVVIKNVLPGRLRVLRFAWNEIAQPNLINSEGWPAYPFRSNAPGWEQMPPNPTQASGSSSADIPYNHHPR